MIAEKKIIISILKEKISGLLAIYLFGSRAMGQFRDDSDYDIGIYFDTDISTLELYELSNRIAKDLKNDVQIIDMAKASEVMNMQIVSKGHILYKSDKYSMDVFENRIYSLYIDLNENRREILESVREEKSVYG